MQNTPSSQSTFYSMLTDQDQSIPTSPSRDLRRSPRHIKSPCLPSYQSTEQTHLCDTTVTTSRKRQHYDQIYNNRIQHKEDTSAKFSTDALQKKNALHMESPIPKVTSISNPVYAGSPDTQRCSSTKVGSFSSICSSIKPMDNPSCSPSHQTPKHSASVPYECAQRSSFDDIDLWFYKQNPPLSNMQNTPSRATFHSRLTENDNQQYNMHILTSQSKTARRSPRHTKTSCLPSYQSAEQTHQDANPNENHSTATNCRTNLTQENSHHDKRSRARLYFEESSTDQISTEEQNEKYPILDEDSELKIHVILESLMWNDTIPENGGPILSRQILAALVPESTLVHSSVAGKTCRPINKTILLRIKGAVRYVYGKRRRGRKEFESLWSKCLTSIGHMCKTLRSKQIKSEIDGTKVSITTGSNTTLSS